MILSLFLNIGLLGCRYGEANRLEAMATEKRACYSSQEEGPHHTTKEAPGSVSRQRESGRKNGQETLL